jgi:hypothetical protein
MRASILAKMNQINPHDGLLLDRRLEPPAEIDPIETGIRGPLKGVYD